MNDGTDADGDCCLSTKLSVEDLGLVTHVKSMATPFFAFLREQLNTQKTHNLRIIFIFLIILEHSSEGTF